MKKITKYKIICGESISGLVELVGTYIECGWQPMGAFVPTKDAYGSAVYSQTLVKYEEKDEPI